jgi:hypothetical protein
VHIQTSTTTTTSKEVSFNPLPKQSASQHCPFIPTKLSLTPALLETNMPMLLLEIRLPLNLMLLIPPPKQLALSLREIPFTAPTGLQKNMKTLKSYKHKTALTRLSHLPQGSNTYPTIITPCKYICIPSINLDMPKLKQTIMSTIGPLIIMILSTELLVAIT